jgi:hypothetical protein
MNKIVDFMDYFFASGVPTDRNICEDESKNGCILTHGTVGADTD